MRLPHAAHSRAGFTLLVQNPGSDAQDLGGQTIPAAALPRWDRPCLERSPLQANGSLATAARATIQGAFQQVTLSGTP